MKRIIPLLMLAFVAAACHDEGPTVPTDGPVFAQSMNAAMSYTFELEPYYVWVECANESVLLSGTIHFASRMATDASGGFHLFFHSNPQGVTGVGEVSGDTYRGTGMSRQTHTFIDLPFTDTFINNFRIIGPGPENNYLTHFNAHTTINANGEMVVFADNFTAECR